MQNINSIIELLKKNIRKLSNLFEDLSKNNKLEVRKAVFDKLNLFLIYEEPLNNDLKIQAAIEFASYLLINQILFYYLYSVLSKKVPQLDKPLKTLRDLKLNFNKISEKEYELIYSIDLISILSNQDSILKQINDFIRDLKPLRPELIQQDIIGRLFQETILPITRKKSSAFYTRPAAAVLLAQLAVDTPDEKVIDIACGTGTLLLAAYRRKLDLMQEDLIENNSNTLDKIHNSILKDIIGLEIMPFAAYLAAINLSLQNLNNKSEKIKISVINSLNIDNKSKLTPISKQIIRCNGNLFNEFSLENIDTVIMNPPFTRKEILPKNLKKNILSKWSNFRAMSYWGYFILLADELLNIKGKIAAVIPSGFFRGSDTLDLRDFLFNKRKYRILYVVKLCKDVAFTEFAIHRDFLVVLEKGTLHKSSTFGMVYLTESINELDLNQIRKIGSQIKKVPRGKNFENRNFKINWINNSSLWNLYSLIIVINCQILGFNSPFN